VRAIAAGDYIAQTFTAGFVADVTNSSNQNAGTLPDARLSTNVPRLNVPNTFIAGPQELGAAIWLRQGGAPVDQRLWSLLAYVDGIWYLDALTDAGAFVKHLLILNRNGDLTLGGFLSAAGGLNASQLVSGTVADARLSANVALRNISNVFAAANEFQGFLALRDLTAPADARLWKITSAGGPLYFQAVNDQGTVQLGFVAFARDGSMTTPGNLTEKSRTTPVGHWIDVPFSAANFGATDGTWTVTAQSRFSYMLVGKTAVVQLLIPASTVGGAPSSLNVVMPFSLVPNQTGGYFYNVGPSGNANGTYMQPTQDMYLRLQRDPFGTPFAAGPGYVYAALTLQIL
jgi:hypothetical protein